MVNSLAQPLQPGNPFAQLLAVALQRGKDSEIRASHDFFDLLQRNIKLTVKQYLLQQVDRFLPVIAIAIIAKTGWLESSNRIVVVQCARRNACQPGELLYRQHGDTINPDVTLMSRVSQTSISKQSGGRSSKPCRLVISIREKFMVLYGWATRC